MSRVNRPVLPGGMLLAHGAAAGIAPVSPAVREPILSFSRMTKTFGGTIAVNDVSLDVHTGEILALLGENGAGKSTLIKMLAGIHEPDSGEIRFAGRPYNPRADARRVSFIHQDLGLIEWMTVAENMALSRGYRRSAGLIDWRGVNSAAEEALALIARDIDPERRVQELSRTEKSLVAIARAISVDASVLVLDEPTASLPKGEVEILFEVLRSLKERDVAMIYVSHRLDEVYAISDRLAVLRDGRLVGAADTSETKPDDLVRMIIGRPPESVFVRPEQQDLEPALVLSDAVVANAGPVSFSVRRGEIAALVGLRGAGPEDVARALFGLLPLQSGSIELGGETLRIDGPPDAIRRGIGFVAGDRTSDSVAHGLNVRENMFINPSACGRPIAGWRTPDDEALEATRLGARFGLSPNEPEAIMETLSGGNQQKVVMARWMRIGGSLLVLEDPTAGVDVGAKAEIYRLLGDAVHEGLAVLLISTDFEEVCAICHRAFVFRGGRIVTAFDQDGLTMERLIHAASLEPDSTRPPTVTPD